MLEGGGSNSNTLLGDGINLRASFDDIKEKVEKGPMSLKLTLFLLCSAAVIYDGVAIVSARSVKGGVWDRNVSGSDF